MARIESQALAGYFPTQTEVMPLILRRFTQVTAPGSYCIVDPCAGEGEAVAAFAAHCFGTPQQYGTKGTRSEGVELQLRLIELERARSEKAQNVARRVALWSAGEVQQGDALAATFEGSGASALWLNPPYDEVRGVRFELRFLRRWASCLTVGGQLVLIVPEYALDALSVDLTTWFDDIEVLKYPEPVYSEYKQVVVLGTRRALRTDPGPLPPAGLLAREEGQEQAGTSLRALPPGQLDVTVKALDIRALLQSTTPLATLRRVAAPSQVGLAMRPKPAHVAMALGSGIFNGVCLTAPGQPQLLAKAVFQRNFVTVDEKRNERGEVSKLTQVEKPQLRLTTLDLSTGEYRELSPGTTPSGKTDLEGKPAIENFADLLLVYGDSMVAAMRERCPALHEGQEDVQLAPMARTLFPAQAGAARAALKLIARGETPLILGEIGSGKTSVAAQVIQSLHEGFKVPKDSSGAFAEPKNVRRVRRVLVVCPPHLVKNWQDELRACLPHVPTCVLETVSDVDALSRRAEPLVVGILSREAAKLGHAVEGVSGRCPRCGTQLEQSADKLASSRAVCGGWIREPKNALARTAFAIRCLVQRGVKPGSPALEPLRKAAALPLLRYLAAHTTRLAESWQSKRSRFNDHKVEGAVVAALGLCAPHPRIKRCLGIIYKRSTWMLGNFEHKVDDVALCNALADHGRWRVRKCEEPLYQAVPRPRRFPLAEYICRRHPALFDIVVPDEFHEYSTDGSAQERALHRLTEKIPLCLPLTGSLMNGYAKSLFRNLWAVSRRMREEFAHDEAGRFARLYGYQKRVLTGDAAKEGKAAAYGSASDRVVKVEGGERLSDAPGVLPSFVLRHVLPLSVTLHKRDITPDDRVVDHDRQEVVIEDSEHKGRGVELGHRLKEAVKRDRYDELLAGKLFGQLAEFPSYYDRASSDTGNTSQGDYEIRYPEDVGGSLVAKAEGLPAANWLAKEEWLISTLRRELAEGRNVLLFLWHKELAARLQKLCKTVGEVPAFLDAGKVPAKKRQDWIDREVVRPGKRILITNPSCVQTGLNNLIHFSSAVFFENPGCNPFIARQAVGRLDRITQTKDVRVYWPVYEGVQCLLLDLLQNKTAISQQIDGIDPSAALEMAGGGEATAEVLDVGLAIYKYLGGD